MKTIWKYTIDLTEHQTIEMPKGARILTAQFQRMSPAIWAEVDDTADMVKRELCFVGTGRQKPEGYTEYINTLQFSQGARVFHLFAKPEVSK